MLKKNGWRKDNSIQTKGKLEKKEKLEEKTERGRWHK